MKDSYNQLCVWMNVSLDDANPREFERFCKDEFGIRAKYCEEVITNGNSVRHEEGGRHDLLFYVHEEDMDRFEDKRLTYGISYWEEIIPQYKYLYTNDILEKYPVNW